MKIPWVGLRNRVVVKYGGVQTKLRLHVALNPGLNPD